MQLFMLIIGNEEEEVFSFYWRKKDILTSLPERIEEAYDDDCKEIIEKIDGMPLEKAVKFINRNTSLDIVIEEAKVEGSIDAVMLRQIEREVEFDGPKLKVVKAPKTMAKLAKIAQAAYMISVPKDKCVTHIDGARVS